MLYCVLILSKATKNDTPLYTIGDAISSFLEEVDEETIFIGPVSKKALAADPAIWTSRTPRIWTGCHRFWFKSASKRRWIWSTI
jgi:hypothetical protein